MAETASSDQQSSAPTQSGSAADEGTPLSYREHVAKYHARSPSAEASSVQNASDTAEGVGVPPAGNELRENEANSSVNTDPESGTGGESGVKDGDATPAATNEPKDAQSQEDTQEHLSKNKRRKERFADATNKLVAERDQALKRIAELEQAQSQPSRLAKEPNIDDFESAIDFANALADYKAGKAREEERARIQQESQAKHDQELEISWRKSLDNAKKAFDDYDDVIAAANAEGVTVPNSIIGLLGESEYGAHMLYQLADNPAEIQRLAAMSPAKQAMAIAKMELALSNEQVKSRDTRSVSKAPSPISPIAARSPGAPTYNAANGAVFRGDYQQYRQARRQGQIR